MLCESRRKLYRSAPKTHDRPRGYDVMMKKNDLSEAASNVLIMFSVSVAMMPFVLGDQLIPVLSGFLKEGGVMVDQVCAYVLWLVS